MIDKAPDAFRTISEAAEHLDLPQHVLRFWETRFPQIKPLKRGGGRRYYRPDDVEFLRGLKHLLHAERYTIKGVQKIIKEQGQKAVQGAGKQGAGKDEAVAPLSPAATPALAVARKPIVQSAAGPALRTSQLSEPVPATVRGKLEAALAEMFECRRIIANLNLT
jgi:DNA-binding transcriptional MerR regulator